MKAALVGTANAGKTTLVEALKKGTKQIPKHPIICELAGNFSVSERQHLDVQLKILKAQIKKEEEMPKFISDRSVIDNLVYFLYHYRKLRSKTSYATLFTDYMKAFDTHMRQKPYDVIIFIDEYFTLEDNGIRDLDEEMQEKVFDMLQHLVPLWCFIYKIPYIKITGSTEERIYLLEKALKKYYTQKKIDDFSSEAKV